MSDLTHQAEIACNLSDQELRERRAFVRKTVIPYVLSGKSTASGLQVSFPNEARERVEEFIALESVCCSFLSFKFQVVDERFTLTIEGPGEAKETLDMFRKGLGLS